jgi:hypothetical protein
VESDLGISLFLQIADDALTDQVGCPDDLKDFVVILADEGQLETILGRVDRDGAGLGTAVEAVNDVALDPSQVDGLFERLDDSIVTELGQLL